MQSPQDDGHEALLTDIRNLLSEAEHFEFHDFKNEKYPTPKVMLRIKLMDLANRVVDGFYDNSPSA
jgi:hypothetical protein